MRTRFIGADVLQPTLVENLNFPHWEVPKFPPSASILLECVRNCFDDLSVVVNEKSPIEAFLTAISSDVLIDHPAGLHASSVGAPSVYHDLLQENNEILSGKEGTNNPGHLNLFVQEKGERSSDNWGTTDIKFFQFEAPAVNPFSEMIHDQLCQWVEEKVSFEISHVEGDGDIPSLELWTQDFLEIQQPVHSVCTISTDYFKEQKLEGCSTTGGELDSSGKPFPVFEIDEDSQCVFNDISLRDELRAFDSPQWETWVQDHQISSIDKELLDYQESDLLGSVQGPRLEVAESCEGSDSEIRLPEDLLINIFLRIPGNVFKFRRLSKYYEEFLGSPHYIREHQNSRIKSSPSLILHHSREIMVSVVVHLDVESGGKAVMFQPPFKEEGVEMCFVGCRRGIFCYSQDTSLYFWNTLTGAIRRSSVAKKEYHRHRFLFGYDAESDDLKLLKIMHLGKDVYVFDIYRSNSDSWATIEGFEIGLGLRFEMGAGSSQVFVEHTNCGHMLADSGSNKVVMAFDFKVEKFQIIPLPCPNLKSFHLSTFDSCLSLITCCPDVDQNLDVWKMKKYGENNSWSLSSIDCSSFSSSPRSIGFTVVGGRPQLLVVFRKPMMLYLYDVLQRIFTKVELLEDDGFVPFDDVHGRRANLQWDLALHAEIPQHYLFAPSCRHP